MNYGYYDTPNTIGGTIDVAEINRMVTQGLDYLQNVNTTIAQTNGSNTQIIFRDLGAIQRTLQNIQGNLTGITPLAQGEVLANNTEAAITTPQLQPPQQQGQQPSSPSPFS